MSKQINIEPKPEQGEEQVSNTDNLLKTLRKDIPLGSDVIYVSISHIIGHNNEDFVFYGLTLTIILMSLIVGLYQYLIISQKNKWYYNAIYSCKCHHCTSKKNVNCICMTIPKHKFLGFISAILHIFSFIVFVYFHGQPFRHYGLYNDRLSFIFLILWTFINGVLHKVIQINVPKYVHININYLRELKNRKKELLANEYKRKLERCFNGLIEEHTEFIRNVECNKITFHDCECEAEIAAIEAKITEIEVKKQQVDEKEQLVVLEEQLDVLNVKEKQFDVKLKIIDDDTEEV